MSSRAGPARRDRGDGGERDHPPPFTNVATSTWTRSVPPGARRRRARSTAESVTPPPGHARHQPCSRPCARSRATRKVHLHAQCLAFNRPRPPLARARERGLLAGCRVAGPLFTMPVRVHLLTSPVEALRATRTALEIAPIFDEVNEIWSQACIRFVVGDVVSETVPQPRAEARARADRRRASASREGGRLLSSALPSPPDVAISSWPRARAPCTPSPSSWRSCSRPGRAVRPPDVRRSSAPSRSEPRAGSETSAAAWSSACASGSSASTRSGSPASTAPTTTAMTNTGAVAVRNAV